MSQFYTLEEAATKLSITTDQLRDLARKKEIRSLLDQGKLRFRAEDVDSRINMLSTAQDMTQDLDSPFALDEPPSKPQSQAPKEETPFSLDLPDGDDFNISLDDVTPASGRGQQTQIAPKSNLPGGPQDPGDLFDSSAFDIADSSESTPQSKVSGPGSELPTDSPFEISEPNIDLGDVTGDTAEISHLDAVNPESKEMTLGDIDMEGSVSEGHPTLSLEGSSSEGGSSDFELSLDEGGDVGQEAPSTDLAPSSSESEFELTMDEEIGVREDALEPSSDDFAIESGDGPDSGSQVVEVDGSLEQDSLGATAEFHAGEDIDEIGDEESSSQVVEVPEDDIAEVSTADDVEEVAAEDSAIIEGDFESPEEEMAVPIGTMSVATAEAPWGVLPAFLLIPTVVVLFVVSLLIFELMRNMWSYNKGTGFSSIILKPLTELFVELPKN